MSLEIILFWVFAGIVVLSAGYMLFTNNVLYAAYSLVLCLVSVAAIYVLFKAEFLAVVQLLVYAGGVIVLLAFGIMLTNRKVGSNPTSDFHLVFPAVLIAGGFILVGSLLAYQLKPSVLVADHGSNLAIASIGEALVTTYLIPFELIGYLLLVVLVGASYLAKPQLKK